VKIGDEDDLVVGVIDNIGVVVWDAAMGWWEGGVVGDSRMRSRSEAAWRSLARVS
jgi:hypothetical protein